MDEVVRIVGAGLALTVIMTFLRERYPALAVELNIAFVFGVLLLLIGPLGRLVQAFIDLGERAQVNTVYLDTALRAVAVAYLTAFGAQISKDAGEEAMATVVELAGKIVILVLALPMIVAIVDTLTRFLP